jgi:tetratricopeptide (TPR) repeat protein
MYKRLFWLLPFFLLACGGNAPDEAASTLDANGLPASARTGIPEIDSLTRLIAQDPTQAEPLARRARAYLAIKDLKNALADAQGARNLDSNSTLVQLTWGEVNFVMNRTRLSKDAWLRCIALDPNNLECRLKLAELYLIVALYDDALKQVNQVLERDPQNGTAYFMKGVLIRDKAKDTALAISYFQKAVDLDNNDVDALEMLGVLYAKKRNPLAVAYYERALALEPNRADLYFDLGVYYMDVQDWNGALINYTKAIQLKPDYGDALFNLGYVHIQLKGYAEARKHFTAAIQANPRDYRSYYARGFCFETLGDVGNARRDYEEALKYAANYGPAADGVERLKRLDEQYR